VTVGERAVRICSGGSGGPLVVFESGLGDGAESWSEVLSEIGAFARVLAYDRAGYAGSTPAPGVRDAAAIASELDALLRALHAPRPIVLVGHSLGGLFARQFALAHPADVAALVLVDPTPEGFRARQRAVLGEARFGVLLARLSGRLEGVARLEFDALPRSALQVAESPQRVPAGVLLSAERADFPDPEFALAIKAAWLELHAALARQLGIEQRRVACGHYIQREQPRAVIAAIRSVVEPLRH
jgi:pimeloyl-ACP methyl ester carboxylesterase